MRKDYHMHPTVLKTPERFELFVKEALRKNIGEICVTDHMPLSLSHAKDRLERGRVRDYCARVRALAAEYADRLSIKCGIEIDYEAELVLIMGENGKIFAATCGNDFSIREWQKATTQWLCGKSYDGFGPIGPYAVDFESLPKGGLGIQCRVNGELRQNSRTDDLIFDEQAIVDFLMPRIPLKAGDVIFTGTPSGVMMGWPVDKKQWLKSGDVVEVTIEGIGTLKNTLK